MGSREIRVGGCCPVQGHGTLPDGKRWYFRARGCSWSLKVGPERDGWAGYVADEDAVWRADGDWGVGSYDAGFMAPHVARAIIDAALDRYESGEPSWVAPDNFGGVEKVDPWSNKVTP